MIEKITELKKELQSYPLETKEGVEEFRLLFLARKGKVTLLFDEFKSLSVNDKKIFGASLNELKVFAQTKFDENLSRFSGTDVSSKSAIDETLPSIPQGIGASHPITITLNRVLDIFERMGFSIKYGPEIETDWYNFTALNFPFHHPAREMQDTFFIEKNQSEESREDILLRTHTSNVQIRLMENDTPPFRSIMPGRVYRNEAVSARSNCLFHQVEGLYVDKNVGFADLKDTLYYFAKEMFGSEVKLRYRPSFFPFTEPSAEIDISCLICEGKGCNVCKHSGWVEIAGSGMVDVNVLENCGISSKDYTGFAFGMGIERITMLKYQISDLRLFLENDVRFLQQFIGK